MATLVAALHSHGLAKLYCGATLDVFHRGYGFVLVWPALARDAFAEADLTKPHGYIPPRELPPQDRRQTCRGGRRSVSSHCASLGERRPLALNPRFITV